MTFHFTDFFIFHLNIKTTSSSTETANGFNTFYMSFYDNSPSQLTLFSRKLKVQQFYLVEYKHLTNVFL